MKGKIIIDVSRDTEFTEDQRTALIAALEFLFGMRSSWGENGEAEGVPFGWAMESLGIYTGDIGEWRKVALEKWNHYRKMVEDYETAFNNPGTVGPSSIALDVHQYGLVKMIPYLLGRPDLALNDDPVPAAPEQPKEAQKLPADAFEHVHHHEERMPAYPATSLEFPELELPGMWSESDFTGGQDEVRPKAVTEWTYEECGAVYSARQKPCSKAKGHEKTGGSLAGEHSNGDWHWREPAEVTQEIPRRKPKFMRGAEDDNDEYAALAEEHTTKRPIVDVPLPEGD